MIYLIETENNPEESEKPSFEGIKPPFLKDRRFLKGVGWSGGQYKLVHMEFYSPDLLLEFERRFEAAVAYLTGNPLKNVANEFKMNWRLIRSFAMDLIEGKTMEEILKRQIGYRGKYGLDYAIAQLKIVHFKTGKLPVYDDWSGITNAIALNYWVEFGIENWNDLLLYVFGKVNAKFWDYSDENLLEKIQEHLHDFKQKNSRLPKIKDVGMEAINWIIRKGLFKRDGISSWTDLLKYTFREVNIELNKYIGLQGLENAIEELKVFYEQNGRIATTIDKSSIYAAIERGEWTPQIDNWDDLLYLAYKNLDIYPFKYMGKEGLECAIRELKDFRRRNKRLPIITDMPDIFKMIRFNRWIEFGIENWNNLLQMVFGETNREHNKWLGEKGIQCAIKRILDFKARNKQMPCANEVKDIRGAIRHNYWVSFGIKKWSDLIKYIYKENKEEDLPTKYLYIGKQGLKFAVGKLKEFEKKYNRKPKYEDKAMRGVINAIERGEWVSTGINNWNNLLLYVFGEVNAPKNKYKGKKGLETAIRILKDFEKKNKKIPRSKDKGMLGIAKAMKRGEWINQGLTEWNDLLQLVFGKVHKKRKKWFGKEGLERAVLELVKFKEKHKRLPKSRDMQGIYRAKCRGEWQIYGINIWDDLLKLAFKNDICSDKKR